MRLHEGRHKRLAFSHRSFWERIDCLGACCRYRDGCLIARQSVVDFDSPKGFTDIHVEGMAVPCQAPELNTCTAYMLKFLAVSGCKTGIIQHTASETLPKIKSPGCCHVFITGWA